MSVAAYEPYPFTLVDLEADPLEEHLRAIALPEVVYADHAPTLYKQAWGSREIFSGEIPA
jgi:hypothetical protein